jgi:hypothetical protein
VTADEALPKKRRHTAHRSWQRLVAEHGAQLGESTVRRYVARLRRELGGGVACVTVPQVHHPGAEGEVDVAELWGWLEGALSKLWLFTMRLSASGRASIGCSTSRPKRRSSRATCLASSTSMGVPRWFRYDSLKRLFAMKRGPRCC